MKKNILAIAAVIMLAGSITILSCNKESVDNKTSEQSVSLQPKTVYPPLPSWTHVSSVVNILRKKTQNSAFCGNMVNGYFCGMELDYETSSGPATVYYSSGTPLGLQISNSFLTANNLSSIVLDSVHDGYLTFDADIDIVDGSLRKTLGFNQIPAGRYEIISLGDSAVYIEF